MLLTQGINPLDSKGNYGATSNTKLVYTGRWWVGSYIWYSEEEPGRALLAVSNVTTHPSTASVPITVLLYDRPLFCGFNVAIIGLRPANSDKNISL